MHSANRYCAKRPRANRHGATRLSLHSVLILVVSLSLVASLSALPATAQPETSLDLATIDDGDGILMRVYGADGEGAFGVPLAAGHDVDGDSIPDSMIAFLTASPNDLHRAGEVDLVFGTGVLDGSLETAFDDPAFLRIWGERAQETTGAEVWMDDVTGDGLGDLLICRQNYTLGVGAGSRVGAGALTILPGGAHLRTLASSLTPIELASAPASVRETTIIGADDGDRLCIWVRTGDVDGDGIADLVVGADQEAGDASLHRGGLWLVRGGSHLDDAGFIDLADFGTPGDGLAGDIAHVIPAGGASHLHAGATCTIGDLDGDGRGEVIFATTLNRAGAAIAPPNGDFETHASGGTARGSVLIAWDEHFPATPWALGYELTVPGSAAPNYTFLDGEAINQRFGEELLAGEDLNGDGDPDLVIGDLQGDPDGRTGAGIAYAVFEAHLLKGEASTIATVPAGVSVSRIWGPTAGDLGADSLALGNFDGDEFHDILFASPHASPQGRFQAGQAHIVFGQSGAWPSVIDLGNIPAPETFRVAEIDGKEEDDVLAYSVASGELDGDGKDDLVINEMKGDAPTASAVGNLLLITGRTFDPAGIFTDGFESGDTSAWSSTVP